MTRARTGVCLPVPENMRGVFSGWAQAPNKTQFVKQIAMYYKVAQSSWDAHA